MIQGTNIPLKVIFDADVTDVPMLVITLWYRKTLLKRWDKEDMTIEKDTVYLPLEQTETMAFPDGSMTLEAKGLNESGQVIFWEEMNVGNRPRRDRGIILPED